MAVVGLNPNTSFAAFDAGYVFPDQTMVADTMTESQIQAFLVQKGSFLASYKMPANRQVPYPCDKDGNGSKESTCYTWLNNIGWNNNIDFTGASAAHVIYEMCRGQYGYGINPQIILVTLQKEQSSITSPTQTRAGQIYWATGYGVPDGSGADYHYYGFAKQVDMAAWQFRWVYEGSGGNRNWYPPLPYGGSMWDVGKTVSCPTGIWETWEGTNIAPCITTKITSRTASALYKHNPYRVNKLGLYNIFTNWFPLWDNPPAMNLSSGSGFWDTSKSKFSTQGDFNGDGKTDIGAMYDYGNGKIGVWAFESNGLTLTPRLLYQGQKGYWNVDSTKWFLGGDYNGDKKDDIAALYDYGNGKIGIWGFVSQGGLMVPRPLFVSKEGFWDTSKSKFSTQGDFNGDGKTDIGAMYDYGNGSIAIWDFISNGTTFTYKTTSSSSTGCWNTLQTKWLLGGNFFGDRKDDIAALYDYGNGRVGIWTFLYK